MSMHEWFKLSPALMLKQNLGWVTGKTEPTENLAWTFICGDLSALVNVSGLPHESPKCSFTLCDIRNYTKLADLALSSYPEMRSTKTFIGEQ